MSKRSCYGYFQSLRVDYLQDALIQIRDPAVSEQCQIDQMWYFVNQSKAIEISGKLHSKRTEKFDGGDFNFYEVSPEVRGQPC